MAETLTLPGVVGVYEYPNDVMCNGLHHGRPCDKIIAKNLHGSVSLKCPRCGHIETYGKKLVDSSTQ